MDEQGRYTPAERQSYRPPNPCPDCGSWDIAVAWIDATDLSDPPGTDLAIPGAMRCRQCRNMR